MEEWNEHLKGENSEVTGPEDQAPGAVAVRQVCTGDEGGIKPHFHSVSEEPKRRASSGSPRITLRLTEAEYAQLKHLAGGMSLSAYVRRCLFGKDAAPRKVRRREPVKDEAALSQVLGLLGQTHMASNLNQIARQANCGTLVMDEETEKEIRLACARIAWVRVKLMEALGLKDSNERMILKGSQRAGASQLARHLSNLADNDHVEVHALRGFVADTLLGALNEAYAVSRGTRCRQFLFSLSLNPPEKERVAVEIFEGAIDAIEAKLGLSGQPRALIFHEKDGRRHAHVVWSRIDPVRMKAVNLPHYKLKLRDMSRQLYLENDWKMPRGLMNSAERDPLNFTLAEWQQARRANTDPRVIKGALQDCWAVSDSKAAFANALAARGFYLARGDRRGHVVIDWRGDVYAVSRWVGVRAKDVRAKLGEPDELPSVEEVRRQTAARFGEKLKAFIGEVTARHEKAAGALEKRKRQLVADQLQGKATATAIPA